MKKIIMSIIILIFCSALCANVFSSLSVFAKENKEYIDMGEISDTGVDFAALDNTDIHENSDSVLGTNAVTVRVGYYDNDEPEFQDGFSDDVRK
ncbi:MAG: hypothetical protein NC293_14080, partial [Roseburia sp.]|nr:hypothetical protein [Roseburia sp.]